MPRSCPSIRLRSVRDPKGRATVASEGALSVELLEVRDDASRPHALDPLRRVPLTAGGTRARPSRRSKIGRQVGARAKVGTDVSEYNHDQATRHWRWCLDYIGCAGTEKPRPRSCVKRAEC